MAIICFERLCTEKFHIFQMAEKRQRIADLLSDGVPIKIICELLDVKKSCVYKVRKKVLDGTSLDRKKGSGGHNLKRDDDFLTSLASEINAKPDTSMRDLAMMYQVDEKTIRTAVKKDLGLYFVACGPQAQRKEQPVASLPIGGGSSLQCDQAPGLSNIAWSGNK